MKRILLAGAALLALTAAQPTLAADAPVYKGPAPAAAALFNWSGCYIGANVGYGWARTEVIDLFIPATPESLGSHTGTGVVGGGQIGCDYQTGPWVFGIQGMFNVANLHGRHIIPQNPNVAYNTQIPWFATLTGRIGYAIQPAALIYAKGGVAWAQYKENQEFPLGTVFDSGSLTVNGWLVGGGFEYLFAPHWSAFVEYSYMRFGQGDPMPIVSQVEFKRDVQTVLFGINFRFGSR